MMFKNDLERRCFEIAQHALGGGVTIEHNKTIQIEAALFPEVASFKGPPAKEIDVLAAELMDDPKITLLVSCKLLSRRAEPAHVQEWGAVIQTMNKYAKGTPYLGLVVSPTGFTSGCEAWATSHNLGMIPPLKGRRIAFDGEIVFRMFERVLRALHVRVRLQHEDLSAPPAFFDFVYRLVADYEGHQEADVDSRYAILPKGWPSSFAEMYREIEGRTIHDLLVLKEGAVVRLSGDIALRFGSGRVQFGSGEEPSGPPLEQAACRKNIQMEPCTLDFVKSLAIGKQVTSAADFGDYLELGLERRFNLGLHDGGFHVISTENPIEDHRL